MDLDGFSLAKRFAHVGEVTERTVLTDELARGHARANLSDPHKRAKTRRFLAGQLDPTNQRATLDALEGRRHFDRPTLLVWGGDDPHFGPQWAERLATDIPGVERVEVLADAGHLVMEDRPRRVAELLIEFVATPTGTPQPLRSGNAQP
jgi:pimeloyl-ACP methyl ester carboxylesterase